MQIEYDRGVVTAVGWLRFSYLLGVTCWPFDPFFLEEDFGDLPPCFEGEVGFLKLLVCFIWDGGFNMDYYLLDDPIMEGVALLLGVNAVVTAAGVR